MRQQSLFERPASRDPLASRMRPATLEEFVGQQHLLGPGMVLRQLIDADMVSSMIFWGPPGVGKTTLARIIANRTHANFVDFSAVTSGIKEIKAVMAQAEDSRRMGDTTILFVDEIHRFNRAQQDAFLPYVERGSIILIGATTENPSFEVNAALLSRCKVFVLQALSPDDLTGLLRRTLTDPRGFGDQKVDMSDEMLHMIGVFANGDARVALSTLEMAVLNGRVVGDTIVVDDAILEQITSKKSLLYDKGGEEHYNIISALHKSMRNSDVNAAIYWLARMLEAGEDPLYVARRLVRFASEDVGMADSGALQLTIAAYQACHFLGMPECNVHLTHAVTYLSLAPKSNALDAAYGAARRDANETLAEPVPLVIRNAPTKLMEQLDYGKGYQYAHDYEDKITDMQCMPDSLLGHTYYHPTTQGREARVKEWMGKLEAWRAGNREALRASGGANWAAGAASGAAKTEPAKQQAQAAPAAQPSMDRHSQPAPVPEKTADAVTEPASEPASEPAAEPVNDKPAAAKKPAAKAKPAAKKKPGGKAAGKPSARAGGRDTKAPKKAPGKEN